MKDLQKKHEFNSGALLNNMFQGVYDGEDSDSDDQMIRKSKRRRGNNQEYSYKHDNRSCTLFVKKTRFLVFPAKRLCHGESGRADTKEELVCHSSIFQIKEFFFLFFCECTKSTIKTDFIFFWCISPDILLPSPALIPP